MRITQLTPGTGHFYCGNCLRENTLAQGLRGLGHDVTMIPLYLPVFTEETEPQDQRVFLGGINMYLQHALPLYENFPGFLTRLLDAAPLLRWSSRQADMTDAAKHADLAVAMLRGDDHGHVREVRALLRWMNEHDRPEVVSLCNVMLAGLAQPVKEDLNVPVVCTLHGEDAFLDALPEPSRSEAWATLRDRVQGIDAFVAVSAYYGDRMKERFGLRDDRVHVVHNGIRIADFAGSRSEGPKTIGYLAHMCTEKGLHTLIDAFVALGDRDDVRLAVAGVQLKGDREFVRTLEGMLSRAGCRDRVTFHPNLTREEKLTFLHSLDVLSVPATYGEAFGLYVIEALACGVPVVQPRHGAFPEIIERTGGGILVDPDDPSALAAGLSALLDDDDRRHALGEAGRRAVHEHFSVERMAQDVSSVYRQVINHGS